MIILPELRTSQPGYGTELFYQNVEDPSRIVSLVVLVAEAVNMGEDFS